MLSVDGDADAAVENRIRNGWNNFRQLVPLLTNHRLHKSASPVLMAIHHSYGRFCDFLLFFAKTPGVRPLNRSSHKMA